MKKSTDENPMRDSWKPEDKAAEAAIDNPEAFAAGGGGEAETVAPERGARNSRRYLPHARESGKLGWIFLWLIGVPIPVLLVLFLLRGCT
jgi:hypothetical protein